MAVHFPPSIKWKPKRELRSQRVVGRCPCPAELGLRPSRRVENPPEKKQVSSSCLWAPEVSSCHQAWSRVDHLIVMTVSLGQRGSHPVQEVLREGCCLKPTCPDNWHCQPMWYWWLRENVIFVLNNVLVGSDSWQVNNMESTFSWWSPIHDSLTAG